MGTVRIPDKKLQPQLQNKVYEQEKMRLSQALTRKQNPEVKAKGEKVLQAVEHLKQTKPSSTPKLTQHLKACHQTVNNPNEKNTEALQSRAQKAQGRPSVGWKILGAAMVALGVCLIPVGGLTLLGSLLALPTGIGTAPGVVGTAVGAGMTGVGVASVSAGAGFFSHGRQKGLSKDLESLATEMQKPGLKT